MEELERTYLAKYLPSDLQDFPAKEMLDIYLPSTAEHPTLRIRKNGQKFEITKKEPIAEADRSEMLEQTVPLTAEEYAELSTLSGKRVGKTRYAYQKADTNFEVDVFTGDLEGLVLVDVEFESTQVKSEFEMPDFCLAEVTQESFTAGGMLCGKKYMDIEADLKKFNYQKLK